MLKYYIDAMRNPERTYSSGYADGKHPYTDTLRQALKHAEKYIGHIPLLEVLPDDLRVMEFGFADDVKANAVAAVDRHNSGEIERGKRGIRLFEEDGGTDRLERAKDFGRGTLTSLPLSGRSLEPALRYFDNQTTLLVAAGQQRLESETLPTRRLTDGALPRDLDALLDREVRRTFNETLGEYVRNISYLNHLPTHAYIGGYLTQKTVDLNNQAKEFRSARQQKRSIEKVVSELSDFLQAGANAYPIAAFIGRHGLVMHTTLAECLYKRDLIAEQLLYTIGHELPVSVYDAFKHGKSGQNNNSRRQSRVVGSHKPDPTIKAEVDDKITAMQAEGLSNKAIYRKLLKQYHPDSSESDERHALYVTSLLEELNRQA